LTQKQRSIKEYFYRLCNFFTACAKVVAICKKFG